MDPGADDILVSKKNNGKVHRIVDSNILDEPALYVNVANMWTRGILGIDVARNFRHGEIYVFLYYTQSSKGIEASINTTI